MEALTKSLVVGTTQPENDSELETRQPNDGHSFWIGPEALWRPCSARRPQIRHVLAQAAVLGCGHQLLAFWTPGHTCSTSSHRVDQTDRSWTFHLE